MALVARVRICMTRVLCKISSGLVHAGLGSSHRWFGLVAPTVVHSRPSIARSGLQSKPGLALGVT
jgi:hypothetical protein